jgi:hypothetical protein
MFRRPCVLVVACWLVGACAPAARAEGVDADLGVLRAANLNTDGASLLTFFKKRTLSEETRARIAAAVAQLGADQFKAREKATNDLVDVGPPARALLVATLKVADNPEVRRRARWALERIGSPSSEAELLLAAARVLVHRKPAGSAEVLLNFLPNVEEEEVAEEIAQGVSGVAMGKDGKPDPAVLLALSDRLAIKRYAAAHALARVGGGLHRAAVRKLLKDADAGVRRRVALSLLMARDKEAVPALIALLDAGGNDAAAAEEALMAVAGDRSPATPLGDGPGAREKYRKDWEAWWKESAEKIDLAKVDLTTPGRGYTLLAVLGANVNNGKVQELDAAGKVRWTIPNLRYPIHASMARRDRVLVCEYYGNRVTERDLKGNVIWEYTVAGQVLSAKRLPNGNTFVASRNLLLELNKSGKVVKTLTRGFDILAAERYKDGTTLLITTNQRCVKLDPAGRETSSFNVGFVTGVIGFKACFLPKGGVIVPDYSQNRVREYDASGKVVRDFTAGARPIAVSRAANGNWLVINRLGRGYVELDKSGKQVNTHATDGRALFVERR